MAAELKALRDIISQSVDAILDISSKSGLPFPSLDNPVDHSAEFSPTGIRNDPRVVDAAGLIVAAAYQLIYTVRPPAVTVFVDALRWTLPSALGVVNEINVAEIIRDAGPKGMHVNEISRRGGTDAKKLSRILRYLASNHWFREVSPDVFANNLLSSMLDTGKKLEDIQGEGRATKHDNTTGMSAMIACGSDECFKAGAWMTEYMMDPKTAESEEPKDTPCQLALGFPGEIWEFYEQPDQHVRHRRFAALNAATLKIQPPSTITSGFEWSAVPHGGLLADIGGGLGHVSLEIAKVRPDLRIIIEDRPPTLKQAEEFWKEKMPTHIVDRRVQFVAHDFFEKQPSIIDKPDIFLLRGVAHDWSDPYLIKLLTHLRAAAVETTKLLVIDIIIEYASGFPVDPKFAQIPGLESDPPPKPLLPNLGCASLISYSLDLLMLTQLNAPERTIGGFVEVLGAAGWKIVQVKRNSANSSWRPTIVAVPV